MNRIYRLVWNKKLNIWTVASETARGATKKRNVSSLGSSKTTDQQSQNHSVFFAIKLLTAAISIVFISSHTFAETNTGGGSANNGSSMAISPTASQCGNASNEAKVDGPGGVAIGCGSAISGVDVNFQQALFNRRGTQVNNYPNGPRSYSGSAVALGRNNTSSNAGGSTLIGNSNVSVGNSVFHNMAVGQGNRVGGTGYNQAIGVGNDIANGTSSTAIGVNNRASGNTSIAMGRMSWADADQSIALGNTATVDSAATNGIAVGHSATTKGVRGIAIGSSTTTTQNYTPDTATNAEGTDSLAIGTGAKGTADQTTAVGRQAQATNANAAAYGNEAQASGLSSAAVGDKSSATAEKSLALGASAVASDTRAFAAGADAQALAFKSVALGNNAVATFNNNDTSNNKGTGAIAIGDSSKAMNTGAVSVGRGSFAGRLSVASGSDAVAGDDNEAYEATAVGSSAKATARQTSAFGHSASASKSQASAFGIYANAEGQASNAFGYQAKSSGFASTAMGTQSEASGDLSTANGFRAKANGNNAVANGSNSNATGNSSVAVGDGAQAQGDNDIAMGRNAATASGNSNNIAVGNGVTTGDTGWNVAMGSDGTTANSRTADGGAVSIGRGQKAAGDGAVAIGDPNSANGDGAVALGRNNTAAGDTAANKAADGAVAIGNENQAIGQGSVAIGNKSKTTEAGSIALGDTADAKAVRGVALGSSAVATNADDVALGAGSKTTTATGAAYRTGTAASSSVVSVGSAGYERRIQNVSAGAADTDAVNVSQLRSVQDGVDELGKSTAEGLGGGSTYDPSTGAVSNPTYNVNGKDVNNVGDAITELDKGWNLQSNGANTGAIKAGDTVDIGTADGEENLQVTKEGNDIKYSLNRDLKVNSVTAGDTVINNDGMSIANGPSVTKSGIDVAGNKISNVAAGTEGTDAVNKDQLDKASQDLTDKGFGLTAQDGTTIQKKLGEAIEVVGADSNITTKVDNGKVAIELAKDLDVNSVTAGDTVINNDGLSIANGPSVTKSGIDVAGNKISNVAAGTEGTDAVNKDQLDKASAASKTEVTEGKNITVTKTTGDNGQDIYNVATADDVEFDSVKVGNVSIDGTTGKISGVTAGDVNPNSTDAINGSQLANNAQSVADALGGGSTVNPDGTLSKPTYNINGTDTNNVGDALAELDKGWTLQSNGANAAAVRAGDTVDIGTADGEENLQVTKEGNDIKYSLNRDLKVNSVTAGDTVINNDGLSIANGPSVTKSGIDVAGNKISNVAAGTEGTDAVNKDQLDKASAASKTEVTEGKNITVTKTTGDNGQNIYNVATADDVEFDSVKVGNVSIDGTTGKISGVTAGDVNPNSTDAINGSQLANNAQSVADALGGGSTVNPDGTVSKPTYNINGTDTNNVGDALAELDKGWTLQSNGANAAAVRAGDTVDIGTADGEENLQVTKEGNDIKYSLNRDLKVNSVTAGDTVINNDGLSIANGPSVTKDGIDAGAKKITNLAAGTVSADSAEAINGSQLHAQGQGVQNIIGGNTVYDPATGTYTNPDIGGTGENNINDAIGAIGKAAAAAKTEVTEGKNITVTKTTGDDGQDIYNVATADDVEFDSVKVGNVSIDGTTGKISGVTAGDVNPNSTDAINGSQLANNAQSVADALGGGSTVNPDGTVSKPTYNINGTDTNNVGDALAELDKGWTLQSNGANAAAVRAGDTVDIGTADGEENLQVTKEGNDIKYSLNRDLKVNSVTAGNTRLDNTGVEVKDAVGNSTTIVAGGTVVKDAQGNSTATTATGTTIKNAQGDRTILNGTGLVFTNASDVPVGPSVSRTGIDAGKEKISNVADGEVAAGSKDAVNGGQLNDSVGSVGDIIGGGVTNEGGKLNGPFTVNDKGYDNIADAIAGESAAAKTEVTEGKNINVTKTTGDDGQDIYNVATADDVEFDSVKVGNVSIDGTTGKISGVTAGDVNPNSTDAINGSQLYGVADSVKNAIGGKTVLNPDGSVTTSNVGNTGQNNIHDAIDSVRGQAIAAKTTVKEGENIVVTESKNADGSTNYEVATAKDVKFDSVTATDDEGNETVLNATGTQVKDGKGNEAEYGAKGISLKDQEGKGTLINQEGMSFIDAAGNNIGPSITAGGINAGNTVIRGVAAGRVAVDSQEAINGSQLHAQGQGVQNIIGGNTQYDPNTGKYTNADIGGTGKDNINDAIGAVGKAAQEAKTTVTEGKNIVVKEGKNADGSTNYEVSTADDLDVNSLTAGGTKIDGNGLTIEGGPSVTKDGINAGDKKVTGVADGAIAAGSKDAVNGGQLHAQGQGVQNIIGGNTQYDPNTGKYTNADIGGTGKDNINDAIGAVGKAAQAAKSTVSNKDRNITVKETSKEDGSRDYEVGLAKDISVDSVTAKDVNANQVNVAGDKGTTNITGGGISVTGPKGEAGPSMTTGGINAGDKKVTGVADGAIHSSSKDAINGSQLHQSYQNVGAALGGGAGYDPEKGWQAPSYNVAGSNYNNVGDALGAIDNRVTNLGDQLQQAFYDTNKRMDKLEDKMSAGIAATAALENAPFVPGKLTMAAGAAYYNDQSAIGVTFRRTADNGRWSLTTGAAMGSQGNSPLVRVGVSTVID
ncbi:hypothetical protein F3J02_17380 [Acinetobacter sp. Tr-809]|uniref:ESPR-type extended signal peptide-containing protein n=1 Tax=Acinetobacter sp. Tr-809 TaxID=2608324 RepID=UPI00141EB1B7|nr:ESPR-type extended signal peptide-containing protein [Acinetobacter sp. Tr-809]NIE98231.1 hypothetical protein [Acinetobacter sp. Tr-809]